MRVSRNEPAYLPPVEIQPAARRLKLYRNAPTPNLVTQNQRPGAEKEMAVMAMVLDSLRFIGVLEVYVFVCLKQSGRRVWMW